MLNKEEIEKIKRGLTEELGRTITANECGLSTNDFSESIKILEGALQYIDQLELEIKEVTSQRNHLATELSEKVEEKQELIERLEKITQIKLTADSINFSLPIELVQEILRNLLEDK